MAVKLINNANNIEEKKYLISDFFNNKENYANNIKDFVNKFNEELKNIKE